MAEQLTDAEMFRLMGEPPFDLIVNGPPYKGQWIGMCIVTGGFGAQSIAAFWDGLWILFGIQLFMTVFAAVMAWKWHGVYAQWVRLTDAIDAAKLEQARRENDH